jgi:hypothetical protein
MDRRNVALVFKACLMEMGENLLLVVNLDLHAHLLPENTNN